MTDALLLVDSDQIKLKGAYWSSDDMSRVSGVHVSLGIGRTGVAEIRVDNSDEKAPSINLGDPVVISITSGEDYTSHDIFSGVVTSLGVESGRNGIDLLITAHDKSVGFGRAASFTTNLGSRPSTVLSKIAGNHGLRTDISLPGEGRFEHMFTTGTELDVLDEIAAVHGCSWWVTDDKLYVKKLASIGGITLTYGEDLQHFRARFGGVDSAKKVEVRRWDPKRKSIAIATHTTTSSEVGASAAIVGSQFSKSVGTAEAVTSAASMPIDVPLASLADGLGARMATSMMVATGQCRINPLMLLGAGLTIAGMGANFNGDYLLAEIEHERLRSGSWVTRFACGTAEPRHAGWAGSPTGSWERLANTVAVGVVTNVMDPDGLNRVKLKIPVISEEQESRWARVVQMGAGANRGLSIMPEVDDEVLIAFENGNLQSPYVLGGLWNGKDKESPVTDVTSGQVMHRTLTSRIGHKMTLHDGEADNEKYFEVTLEDGKSKLRVASDKIEIVANTDMPITISTSKAKIDLDASGNIKMTGEMITLEANKALTLKSKTDAVTVQSATALDVKAGTKLTLKGTAGAELNGTATTDVKGAMVNLN